MKTVFFLNIFLFFLVVGLQQTTYGQQSIGNSGAHALPPIADNNVMCDTLSFVLAPDPWPAGLTYAAGFLWSNGYTDSVIYKMDLSGAIVQTIPSPAQGSFKGGSLDYDGTHLLCLIEQDATIYQLNPTDGAIDGQIQLPFYDTDPNFIGLAYDGQNYWCASHTPPVLLKIDPTTGTVLDSFTLTKPIIVLEYINGILYGIESFFSNISKVYTVDVQTGALNFVQDWCIEQTSDLAWNGQDIYCIQTLGTAQLIYGIGGEVLVNAVDVSSVPSLAVFPNPVEDVLRFSGEMPDAVHLIDITGKILPLSVDGNTCDFSTVLPGIYTVQFRYDDRFVFKKIVKI